MSGMWSLNKLYKKALFGAPSDLTIRRPCENLGTFCNTRTRSSYSVNTALILPTIFAQRITLEDEMFVDLPGHDSTNTPAIRTTFLL
jgi:hypothetical protein